MPPAASSEVAAAVADAHRREWAFVLAATVRITGDIDAAEEAVQDAYASALSAWGPRGIPKNPGAWLTVAARRRALDMHRRATTAQQALSKLLDPEEYLPDDPGSDAEEITDDRLRLIFTCCHPALAPDAQVALTLRLLCGLSTADVARAFLLPEATIAARITRAKKKIAAAHIPYRVPAASELRERLDGVLSVVYLVYTTGHTAPSGENLMRRDLAERGHELARMLRILLPNDGDVAGLLALVLLTDARSGARLDEHREIVLMENQDRSKWDRSAIGEGVALLREALNQRPRAASPSWRQSRPSMMRASRGPTLTGRRSSASTTCSWRRGRLPSSNLTGPLPSASRSATGKVWRSWMHLEPNRNSPATRISPPPAPTSSPGWAVSTTPGSPSRRR